MTPVALLAEVRRLGARVRLTGATTITITGPAGLRDDFLGLLAEVRRQKPEMLALLRAERGTPIPPEDLPGIVLRLGWPKPCSYCGRRNRFWLSVYRMIRCGICHPPATMALVAEPCAILDRS